MEIRPRKYDVRHPYVMTEIYHTQIFAVATNLFFSVYR